MRRKKTLRAVTLTQTTRKKKNKNISAKFFDFLTAHTKQITILIGRLESILFYKKQKNTFAKKNKKRSYNSIGIKRVVQKSHKKNI